ncbi:MAG: RrF2 family transcriptional regulator [Bacillota bacterium]|nr:RrF2 family transcriptional regulator [Bacillota bacterium]
MMISTKGRYALRLMADLALNDNGGFISLRDVSQRQDISVKYLEQIVSSLCKAGYIISTRGARGGYRLGKKPKEYIVGDILRVTEGSLSPVACLNGETNTCPRSGQCLTVDFWQGLYNTITRYVDGVTLEDIIKEEAGEKI